MKQTKLKRKSPSKRRKLITKADRLFQDYMRLKHRGEMCEICGKPFDVSHHYIAKSQSTLLRFDEKNLILVCNSCHFKIHKTEQGPYIGAMIARCRGTKWWNYITKQKNTIITLTSKELQEKVEKYENLLKELEP